MGRLSVPTGDRADLEGLYPGVPTRGVGIIVDIRGDVHECTSVQHYWVECQ